MIAAVRLALVLFFIFAVAAHGQDSGDGAKFKLYPWSEESGYVRVDKNVLSELSIPAVETKDFETMEVLVTDGFIGVFKLTASEVQQVSRAIAEALHEYRTVEGKHFEPTGDPPKVVGRGLPLVEVDQRFHFRLKPFPEESAAIRKRLEDEVLAALGKERSKFFWENASRLDIDMPVGPKGSRNPPGTITTITYTFVLPAKRPGRVDLYRTVYSGSGGGSGAVPYPEVLYQYAPEVLKPIIAEWGKTAETATAKSSKESDAAPAAWGDSKEKEQLASGQTKSPKWDETVPFADVPKRIIQLLELPALTLDEKLLPEAVTLFGLSGNDQKALMDLYVEMKRRFEKLERSHFHRTEPGKNSFVIKAFPEESAALKREWVEKLKELLGSSRGELLERSMRIQKSIEHVVNNPAKLDAMIRELSSPWRQRGRTWLHRGTEETQLNVTTGVNRNGRPTLSIDHKTGGEGGERGSGGVPGGQIPERWQHLITPDMLGLPVAL